MTTENKVWPCKHIIKSSNGEWYCLTIGPTSYKCNHWISCPECGAKRPEGPKLLWATMKESYNRFREENRYSDYSKDDVCMNDALTALKWFEENLPDFIPENSAYYYKGRILEWLNDEQEKSK